MKILIKSFGMLALVCALFFLASCDCNREDDFADYEMPEFVIADSVEATMELSEYDGNVESMNLIITNNGEDTFWYSKAYRLQKRVDEEWKSIKISNFFSSVVWGVEPSKTFVHTIDLKSHVTLPLLPGEYRIGLALFRQGGVVLFSRKMFIYPLHRKVCVLCIWQTVDRIGVEKVLGLVGIEYVG